jgi:hypothetical protein
MTHPTILSLEDVAAHFAQWRQTRLSPKEQIPDHLKEEAVSLIGRYSNRAILNTLRLNNAQLKSFKKKVLLSNYLAFYPIP